MISTQSTAFLRLTQRRIKQYNKLKIKIPPGGLLIISYMLPLVKYQQCVPPNSGQNCIHELMNAISSEQTGRKMLLQQTGTPPH